VVPGLGLLPVRVEFAPAKRLRRPTGTAYGEQVKAYEIHHGIAAVDGAVGDGAVGDGAVGDGAAGDGASGVRPFLDGCRQGAVWGTSWHGILENDGFRRAFLADVARVAGRDFTPAPDVSFAALRAARLDALGDLIERHLDTDAVLRLIEEGAPAELPVVPPGGPLR
jgi:adenosylcobyric acid synthase